MICALHIYHFVGSHLYPFTVRERLTVSRL